MKEHDSYISRMQKMNELIASRCTGTPDEFAGKMNMSLRNLYNYLETLKASISKYGVNVLYNRYCRTYEYDKPGKLEFVYGWKEK